MKTMIMRPRKKTISTESLVAREEFKVREELHKKCTAEISEALLVVDAHKDKIPEEVVAAINTIIWNTQILLREKPHHRSFDKKRSATNDKKFVEKKKEEVKKVDPNALAKNIESVEKFDKKNPLYAEIRDIIAQKTGSFRNRIREAMNEKGVTDEMEIEKARKAIQIYFNKLVSIEQQKNAANETEVV